MTQHINITNHYDFYSIVKQPFAVSSEVTWDLSQVGKITKKRVMKWLEAGAKDSGMYTGQAVEIHQRLQQHFGIPKITIEETWDKATGFNYAGISDSMYEAVTELYKVERVALRLSDDEHKTYYLNNQYAADKPQRANGYLRVKHAQNFEGVKKELAKMVASGDVADRINKAKQALTEGQQITFKIIKER